MYFFDTKNYLRNSMQDNTSSNCAVHIHLQGHPSPSAPGSNLPPSCTNPPSPSFPSPKKVPAMWCGIAVSSLSGVAGPQQSPSHKHIFGSQNTSNSIYVQCKSLGVLLICQVKKIPHPSLTSSIFARKRPSNHFSTRHRTG